VDTFFAWIELNLDTVMLGWGVVVAAAELLKRLIPGTKDDVIIVKVMDTVGKIATIGASSLLPAQDGIVKK